MEMEQLCLSISDASKKVAVEPRVLRYWEDELNLTIPRNAMGHRYYREEELKKINILYKDIENTFQGFFGTKVKMAPGKKRGKIIIEYASNDDLERILNIIK